MTPTQVEKPRLDSQCEEILALLKKGPTTNERLSRIALKYTSRISDLRNRGVDIECYARNYSTGVSYYRLNKSKEAAAV